MIIALGMLLSLMTFSFPAVGASPHPDAPSLNVELDTWQISPSASGTTTGLPGTGTNDAAIAAPGFDTSGWLTGIANCTLLGNMFNLGVYDDFFLARNGGVSTDEWYNRQFTSVPGSDFAQPWWYSKDVTIPVSEAGNRVTLTFKGISHVADIYVNGNKLVNKFNNITENRFLQDGPPVFANYSNLTTTGSGHTAKYGTAGIDAVKEDFIGTFRFFDVDITDYLNPAGQPNNIKVKVTRPGTGSADLTYHWVDWHPRPVDNMMGLTGKVILSTSGDVRLDNPMVGAKVEKDLSKASLNLYADATNLTNANVAVTARAVVKDPAGAVVATVQKDVLIPPLKYNHEIHFRAADFPQLVLTNPELWWPYLSGDQPMYTVDWTVFRSGFVSSTLSHRAGIREITAEINVTPLGNQNRATVALSSGANMIQFYVNHKPILLKGGGYCATDLFLRRDPVKNQGVIDNMKYAGFNFFRDEGKFFDNDLLELCDENGILFQTGWCCCDRHQQPQNWSMTERFIAYEAQYAQIKNIRQYASACLWFNGSDQPPSFNTNQAGWMVEEQYIRVAAQCRWEEMGLIATSACLDQSRLLGGINTGMHMDSSYDNQTPSHFYSPGTVRTGGEGPFGFIGEGHGGAGIPPIESMKKFIPAANLFPYNNSSNYAPWNLHCSTSGFTTFAPMLSIADNTYYGANTLESWYAKVVAQQFDQYRAQSEAQVYHKYTNITGLVSWMMNNARPGMYWQQFDWYMNPIAATYGCAKGHEPVHIMYNMYDNDISVINNTFNDYGVLTASMEIYNLAGDAISEKLEKDVHVVPDGHSPTVTYGTMQRLSKRNASTYNDDGTYTDVGYWYNGQVLDTYGVNILWDNNDIEAALTKATSDVYFIRLELKDADGKVVSYNAYAVAMRSDVATSTSWNRGTPITWADFGALNSLPAIPADKIECIQTGSKTVDGEVIQTLKITNNSDVIAFNVYLAAYTGADLKDLVGPVQFTDNVFILFPGETRIIDVTHRTSVHAGDAVITLTCYNNQVVGDKPIRYKDVYTGNGMGQGRNLSIGRPVTMSSGAAGANIVALTTANITAATAHKTFIDCNSTSVSLTATNSSAWFYVDLGAPTRVDYAILRCTGSNNLRGRPDNVVIAGANSTSGPWTDLATYNNSGGSTAMQIVLPQTATYRYYRATLSGLVSGQTAFNVAGFDLYAFNNYAQVKVFGNGVVTGGGRTIREGTYANQSVITVVPGGVELTFTAAANCGIGVIVDGVDVSDKLVGRKLLLELAADADVEVYFGAEASISASAGIVVIDKPVSFYVTLENINDVNLVEVEFTFDSDYLDIDGTNALKALNGFNITSATVSNYFGSSIYKGKVTLMYPNGFVTSGIPLNVLEISGLTKDKLGNTEVTLDSVKIYGKDASGNADIWAIDIVEDTAAVEIVYWTPIFSKYDLNKGPIVGKNSMIDYLDLSIAIAFYQMRSTDADWLVAGFNGVTGAEADVNGSGVVNLADLIEILVNFGSYNVFPG